MQRQPGLLKKRAPVCGILSLTAPFASLALAFLGDRTARTLYHGDEGMFSAMAHVALPIVGGLKGGILLAGLAALRDEKWSALRWIGFLLSAAPLVYVMLAAR